MKHNQALELIILGVFQGSFRRLQALPYRAVQQGSIDSMPTGSDTSPYTSTPQPTLPNHQTRQPAQLLKKKIHPCDQLPLPSRFLAQKIHSRLAHLWKQSLSVNVYQ